MVDPTMSYLLRATAATPHCVVVDFETSGLGIAKGTAVPLELAFCVLDEQCNIIREMVVLLNWTTDPATDQADLKARMEKTAEQMGGGRRFSATWDRMVAEGVPVREGIDRYMNALNGELKEHRRLAGHNLIGFDMLILAGLAEGMDEFVPAWDPNSYHDTGMIEKGVQMQVIPFPTESPVDYYARIQHGGRYKWSLHSYCREKYGIKDDEWFANHAALSDCRLVARVLKAQLKAGGLL